MSNTPDSAKITELASLMQHASWAQITPLARQMVHDYPDFGFGWAMLGAALRATGLPADALKPTQNALALAPTAPESHSNLGNVLQDLGRDIEALACFQDALTLNSSFVPALYNKGNLLTRIGRHDEALTCYNRALTLAPESAEIHLNASVACRALEQIEAARTHLETAVALNPRFVPALRELGDLLQKQGAADQAVEYLLRAVAIQPTDMDLLFKCAASLIDLNRNKTALVIINQLLAMEFNNPTTQKMHGILLKKMGRLKDAIACFEHSLKFMPNDVDALAEMGVTLNDLGEHQAATNALMRALKINPYSNIVFTNLLFVMSHNDQVTAAILNDQRKEFANLFEKPLINKWPKHNNNRELNKKLQIGFVSGDFRNHAVGHILLPLLKNIAKFNDLELHGFSNHFTEDFLTEEIKANFNDWLNISKLNDDDLARKILDKKIDILIDLSGHTGHNRLTAFAHKPAPIQLSWIGFPGSTGLKSIDYYMAEKKGFPLEMMESQFIEKLVYLPAVAPLLASTIAPAVNNLPALTHGYMTFASFNRPSKIGRFTIKLWSDLLNAVPSSKMLMAGFASEIDNVNRIRECFEEYGVSSNRVSFLPRSGLADYLASHHQVDICLDPFPNNGGTTTVHALSMGVPTLTLAGKLPHSRGGIALNGYVNLDNFVCETGEDYVQKGVWWSTHLDELSEIRQQLRIRLRESPLGDSEKIAESFHRAMRKMWRTWCDGQSPKSFVA